MRFKLIFFVCIIRNVFGIVPTGIIQTVFTSGERIFCAPGAFGKKLLEREEAILRPANTIVRPEKNLDGCSHHYHASDMLSNYYWLVERGTCSFEQKAINAYSSGASGIIVHNSIKGIYRNQSYASREDYECDYGRGYVKPNHIIHPIWSTAMNKIMPVSCTQNKKCHSQQCVFTNRTTEEGAEVCCVFDMFLSMGGDAHLTLDKKNDQDNLLLPIPIVFIRMKDLYTLLHPSITGLFDVVIMYKRYEPYIDPSSLLIWMIAVIVITYSSLKAANDDEDMFNTEAITGFLMPSPSSRGVPVHSSQAPRGGEPSRVASSSSSSGASNNVRNDPSDSTIEITTKHALMWAVCSACMLLLLFYINLYRVISVVYVIASGVASFLVIYRPICHYCLSWKISAGEWLENASSGAGAVLAKTTIAWWMLAMYFNSMWVWIPQNIMGASVCIMAISVIRLPNFKVAAMLLSIMFFYDIFFVFISPYFFSSSIMMKVASGGKQIHHDENFCEKYPDHTDCQKNALPMLFLVPSVLSYSSSGSILGLGDVVLPGLLLAFTARLDTRLFGVFALEPSSLKLWASGAFFPTLIAYATGLLLANFAVIIFETGQPALLYIVPLTLAAVSLWGYSRGCLRDLWIGPSVLYPEAANITVVTDGEDQGLLDSLPMAKKMHISDNQAYVRNPSVNSSAQESKRSGAGRSNARTDRYQTMEDTEYLDDDIEEERGRGLGPI